MGDELKLTTGVISSNSGYKSSQTQYQISAPVQPGNSGGPLFDTEANLIGVIFAKHKIAESASYAIKTELLMQLLEKSGISIKLPSKTSLSKKNLPQQVELLRQYVFIIEASN